MVTILGSKTLSIILSFTIPFFLIFLISGCYSKKSSSDSSSSSENSSESLSPSCTTGLTLEQDSDGNGCFVLSENSVSFIIHAFSSSFATPSFSSLTAPEGTDVKAQLSGYGGTGIPWESSGYSNVLIPLSSTYQATSGKWSYTVSNVSSLKLTSRTGLISSTPTIFIQPYLTGSSFTADNISKGLSVLSSIYSRNGVSLSIDKTISITEPEFAEVSINFNDPTTTKLVSRGSSDKVNLFFIKDYLSATALGNSAGIPGSQGIKGSHNGVLISLTQHLVNGVISDQLLGETAGHEMGHFLGLYHPSESSGNLFDPINDTPECPASKNSNNDQMLTSEECGLEFGADNLMFWDSWDNGSQDNLTEGQIYVLKYAPISN